MYLPSTDTESVTLTRFLEVQLRALRDAGFGLSEEQMRSRPVPSSELTLAGLLKHAMFVMCGALTGAGQEGHPLVDVRDFWGSFTVPDEVSMDELRAAFDSVTARYLPMCEAADMSTELTLRPMPWVGLEEPQAGNLRYITVHHVEELARHAGHADILREAIDGAGAIELNAAVEGRAENQYVTPWSPQA